MHQPWPWNIRELTEFLMGGDPNQGDYGDVGAAVLPCRSMNVTGVL